jgi:hypothetical protein
MELMHNGNHALRGLGLGQFFHYSLSYQFKMATRAAKLLQFNLVTLSCRLSHKDFMNYFWITNEFLESLRPLQQKEPGFLPGIFLGKSCYRLDPGRTGVSDH